MLNISAPPGKELKYARLERERRFLFDRLPDGRVVRRVVIVDRYLHQTRVRVRQETQLPVPGSEVHTRLHKLTQKVPAADGGPGLITTLYLNEAEYELLSKLPATSLRKTRLSIPPFGIDLFEGQLSGLILGEAEFEDDDSLAAFHPPIPVVAEVTQDRRLTGGVLATSSREALAEVLADYGIALSAVR